VYSTEYAGDAVKALARMPVDRARLIRTKIAGVAADPRGLHTALKPLRGGLAGLHRLRIGDWRAVLRIDDAARVVRVVDVAPRGSAYD
jgi:mRNA interferase RelE/StbE